MNQYISVGAGIMTFVVMTLVYNVVLREYAKENSYHIFWMSLLTGFGVTLVFIGL